MNWDQPLGHDEMYISTDPDFTVYLQYHLQYRNIYLQYRNGDVWVAASSVNGLDHTLCESKEQAMAICESHVLTMRLLGRKVV